MKLLQKRCFLFDLDGTLYRGNVAVAGAVSTIELLLEQGIAVRFLSNNSNQATADIAVKLNRMGIPACAEQLYTPLAASGQYLNDTHGSCSVYVVGSNALESQLVQHGHRLDCTKPDVVFVGRDTDFTFEKLQMAGRFLQAGAALVVANCDLHHPGELGYNVPETGAIAAAIACLADVRPEYIGKPEPYLFGHVMNVEQLLPDQLVMVGDNPLTDIAGGIAVGIDTILLSTDIDTAIKPSLRLGSMQELYNNICADAKRQKG